MDRLVAAIATSESIAIIVMVLVLFFMGTMYIRLFNAFMAMSREHLVQVEKLKTILEVIKERLK